ncbi:bikaverin cluster-monooxygenase [Fusarium longipes]|uniref:Bikaverin cluster-monooxygenase n=1 Tax=Fusarium longipes TaxID=694270 RepID=A0A395T8S0_9HYPO|nr:bikaverin cluster-monooxygenase [Fusarium longipes]
MSPTATLKPKHCQVIIVGGGVAGITLALAFERLEIDYVLFEAHTSLAPSEGASIGLLPNGLRILEQLGVLDEIEQQSVALQRWRHINGDGTLISCTSALGHYPSKIGYGGLFLERQKLLEMMAGHLKNKNAIKTSARITSLAEDKDRVTVVTEDGLTVTADLVIGADGVRSVVRKHINPWGPDDCMTGNFACVYGISSPTPGISEGDCFSVYRQGASILGFTGKGGVVFWFVFEDLGRPWSLSEVPRYSDADVDPVCQSVSHLKIDNGIIFADIYANRTIARKVVLEEGMAKTWHSARAVLVGDAAHKMVPNAAMGANQAMESAVVLVNELRGVLALSSDNSFHSETLHNTLAQYAEQRKSRTIQVQQKAAMVCRAQLCHDGPAEAIVKELPTLTDGDWLFRGFMGLADAPVLDHIPLTSRGLMYQKAVESLRKRAIARQKGGLKISNLDLFGLTEGIY